MPRPGPAVDEERVVGLAGLLGDGQRGRVGEAVARADDELLEGVLGVQAAAARAGAGRPGAGRRRARAPSPRRRSRRVASGGSRAAAAAWSRAGSGRAPRCGCGRARARRACVSRTAGQLERLEPDVEREVGDVARSSSRTRFQMSRAVRAQAAAPSPRAIRRRVMREGGARTARPDALGGGRVYIGSAARSERIRRPRTRSPQIAENALARPRAVDRRGRRGERLPILPCRTPDSGLFHEAHLPAKEAQARPHARIPCAHEHPRRPPRAPPPPQQGPRRLTP